MTGLSLSFCVGDIARGKVRYDAVTRIIAGIYAPDAEAFAAVVTECQRTYWQMDGCDPEKAAAIAMQLYQEGKIYQPRLAGQPVIHFAPGEHWTDADLSEYAQG